MLDLGFSTLKDVLDVLLVPITILALGLWIPRYWERQKQAKFIKLVCYEISKIAPQPGKPKTNGRWHHHMPEESVHADIFTHPSEHIDFILELPNNLSHDLIRLWAQYDRAKSIDVYGEQADAEFAETGKLWCKYLNDTCKHLEESTGDSLFERAYEPWKNLISAYNNMQHSSR